MAFRGESSSNEGSPSIIRLDDSEDDLEASFDLNSLAASQTSTGFPLNGVITIPPAEGQEQDNIVSPVKKEESMTSWKFSGGEFIDLSDSDQIPLLTSIKTEELVTPWKFSIGELIEILDSEQNSASIPIKQEKPEGPWKFTKLELVELPDTEDEVSNQSQLPANSSTHADKDHEDTNHDDTNHEKTHKEDTNHEDTNYEDMNHADMNHENANHEDKNNEDKNNENMNHEVGRESARSKLQYLQKMLAERALGRSLAEGADQLFTKLQTPHLKTSDIDSLDGNSWMNATIDSDVDPGAAYAFDYSLKFSAFNRKIGSLQPKKNTRRNFKSADRAGLMTFIFKKPQWLRKQG